MHVNNLFKPSIHHLSFKLKKCRIQIDVVYYLTIILQHEGEFISEDCLSLEYHKVNCSCISSSEIYQCIHNRQVATILQEIMM